MAYRASLKLLMLAALAGPAGAQESVMGVHDVVFGVYDISSGVYDIDLPVHGVVFPSFEMAMPAKETREEVRFRLSGDVLFEFDSDVIDPRANAVLKQLAKKIADQFGRGTNAIIEGHTDSRGSDSYNLELSQRRATSVKAWFDMNAVLGASIRTTGYGESRPLVPNQKSDGSDDPVGRQVNRRVEIVVEKG